MRRPKCGSGVMLVGSRSISAPAAGVKMESGAVRVCAKNKQTHVSVPQSSPIRVRMMKIGVRTTEIGVLGVQSESTAGGDRGSLLGGGLRSTQRAPLAAATRAAGRGVLGRSAGVGTHAAVHAVAHQVDAASRALAQAAPARERAAAHRAKVSAAGVLISYSVFL